MTPRRWRRRIRVTSSRGACVSLVPSDLRIRLPQVYRHDPMRLVELFPQEPRYRQLQQARGLRVTDGSRGELERGPCLGELMLVQDGTVSHAQHPLFQGFELGSEVGR